MYTLNMYQIHAFRTFESPNMMGFIFVYLFPWTSTEALPAAVHTVSHSALLAGPYAVPSPVLPGLRSSS